jgi:hypothetical protein
MEPHSERNARVGCERSDVRKCGVQTLAQGWADSGERAQQPGRMPRHLASHGNTHRIARVGLAGSLALMGILLAALRASTAKRATRAAWSSCRSKRLLTHMYASPMVSTLSVAYHESTVSQDACAWAGPRSHEIATATHRDYARRTGDQMLYLQTVGCHCNGRTRAVSGGIQPCDRITIRATYRGGPACPTLESGPAPN